MGGQKQKKYSSAEGQNYVMIDDRVRPVIEREVKAARFLPGIMV